MLVFLTSIRVGVVKIYRRYFQTELRHVVKEAQQLTRRYSALDRWSTAAFKAALAGKHYDGTIPYVGCCGMPADVLAWVSCGVVRRPKPKNKAKVAAMRPVAWGGDAESAERQRTKCVPTPWCLCLCLCLSVSVCVRVMVAVAAGLRLRVGVCGSKQPCSNPCMHWAATGPRCCHPRVPCLLRLPRSQCWSPRNSAHRGWVKKRRRRHRNAHRA